MNAGVSASHLLMQFLIRLASSVFAHRAGLTTLRIAGGGREGRCFRWTLIVFYSKSLSGGPAPAFLCSLNGHWCVVFAADLCVGGALWFTGLWHRLGSGTREADCGSPCGLQVSRSLVRTPMPSCRLRREHRVFEDTSGGRVSPFRLSWRPARGMPGCRLLPRRVFKYRVKRNKQQSVHDDAEKVCIS